MNRPDVEGELTEGVGMEQTKEKDSQGEGCGMLAPPCDGEVASSSSDFD